ncbi:hypothetical protein CHELA20_53930 [Hyphomicrobiales bacterium]|nr:hypothetical protein CHELA41_20997 [Hyphomicrobiales bacterium]CAH1685234.1 hypothetical protein CHELA20_53930 [Hyphomicrobiales bacterium]
MAAMVKGFGCRQAYESLSCRNPRATVDGYGDFELRPMSALARPALGSAEGDADRLLRCSFARYWRPETGLDGNMTAYVIAADTRGSVVGGGAPAANAGIRPCRVMARPPGLLPIDVAVRAAISSV